MDAPVADYGNMSAASEPIRLDTGQWIRYRGPMTRYQNLESIPWLVVIVGFVSTYAGIRAMFVDGQILIPALGTAASIGATSIAWWIVRRIQGMALRVEESGIRVRNLVAERFIPWDEMRGFSFTPAGSSTPLRVQLASGDPHPIWGVRAAKSDEWIDGFSAAMERELRRRIEQPWWPSPLARSEEWRGDEGS